MILIKFYKLNTHFGLKCAIRDFGDFLKPSDWAIYRRLGDFLKHEARICLAQIAQTFGNFLKSKIFML